MLVCSLPLIGLSGFTEAKYHWSFLATKEAEEEGRKIDHDEELEDELRGENLALLTREDWKMKAEGELKKLQSSVTEMDFKKMVCSLR